MEDASWLRPKMDSHHINVSELDAVIRGLNTALRWGNREIQIMTDSASVFRWLEAIINKSRNIKTRSLYELLIRRRLDIIEEIIRERELTISVKWVASARNRADCLTRIPQTWLKIRSEVACAVVAKEDVRKVHDISHFGVDRTFALAKERFGAFPRRVVEEVVSSCDACCRVDPAPKHRYNKGELATSSVWHRIAVDITHVEHVPYLSIVDTCSRFTIWHRLSSESSEEVVRKLNQTFSEFGPPVCLMSDNGTVFRSRPFLELLQRWNVEQILTCAYRPQGNAIVERMHRTVKRAAKRSGRTVEETTFWINNTKSPSEKLSPYEWVFSARSRKPGISEERIEIRRPKLVPETTERSVENENPYQVGDKVYLRHPGGRCNEPWSGPETVTEIRSDVSVVLNSDGISRHVSHIRPVPRTSREEEIPIESRVHVSLSDNESDGSEDDAEDPQLELRRSSRIRRPPVWYQDYEVG